MKHTLTAEFRPRGDYVEGWTKFSMTSETHSRSTDRQAVSDLWSNLRQRVRSALLLEKNTDLEGRRVKYEVEED